MKLADRLREALDVQAGEVPKVLLLLLHSLANGLFTAFFFSTAYALFLDRFDADTIPWAYVASALVGYAGVALFTRFERRTPLRRLLVLVLGFLLALVLLYWGLYVASANRWIAFLMFVTLSPALVLLDLEFWGLAARVFDLRQAKRLFGLVGTGGVISSIFGFFMVPVLLEVIENPVHLLLVAAAGLAAAIGAAMVIGRRFRGELATGSGGEERPRGDWADLAKDRYFVLLASMTALFVFVLYLVDMSFMVEIRVQFSGSAEVARFCGIFFGAARVAELVMKVFFSGRLVSQFGVRFGLLVLPVTVAALVAAGIVLSGLAGASILFFLIVAAGKLLWIVLRKSLLDPSVKVLYQPMPAEDRLVFQGRVSAVGQVSTLLVGFVLVLFEKDSLKAIYLFYLSLPLFAAWLAVASRLYRAYRGKLMENLTSTSRAKRTASPVELLEKEIRTGAPEDLGYYVRILETLDPTAVNSLLTEKLDHVLPQVRLGVLRRLGETGAVDARAALERSAEEEGVGPVREAAAAALVRVREIADLAGDEGRLVNLLRAGTAASRKEAAQALGWSTLPRAYEMLAGLLVDRDPGVRWVAIVSAGRIGHPKLWPLVVAQLSDPRWADAATCALTTIGPPVLPELEIEFRKLDQDPAVLRRILFIYGRVGGPRARALLTDKIRHSDKHVRRAALRELSEARAETGSAARADLGSEVEATVRTMVWDLAALLDVGEAPEVRPVHEALSSEIAQLRSTLFLLLSLMYDASVVDLIREHVESGESESIVYALEMLEILISPVLKPVVLPVLEELTPPQRLKRLEPSFPWQHMGRGARLEAILFRDYSLIGNWTKACALEAIGKLRGSEPRRQDSVPDILVANLFHPDPMLQELAARYIHRLDPGEYARHARKLPFDDRERVDRILRSQEEEAGRSATSLFDKVLYLTGARGFASLPWNAVIELARGAEDVNLEPGEHVPREEDADGTLYVVVSGLLGASAAASGVTSSRAVIPARAWTASREALEASYLLRIDNEVVLRVMSTYPELLTTVLKVGAQPVLDFKSLSAQHSVSVLQAL